MNNFYANKYVNLIETSWEVQITRADLRITLSIWYTEVVKNIATKKTPGPDVFTIEFYHTSKEEIIPVLQRILPENWRGEITCQFMAYEASVTLIAKPKTFQEKKL